MNSIDLYYSGALLFFVILALRSGFLRTLLSSIGLYIAVYFGSIIASGISSNPIFALSGNNKAGEGVLYLSIFLGIYIATEVFLIVLKNIINIQILGTIDSLLATILGLAKGAVFVTMIINILIFLPMDSKVKKEIDNSVIKIYGDNLIKITYPFFTSSLPNIQKEFSTKVLPAISLIKPLSTEGVAHIADSVGHNMAHASFEGEGLNATIKKAIKGKK